MVSMIRLALLFAGVFDAALYSGWLNTNYRIGRSQPSLNLHLHLKLLLTVLNISLCGIITLNFIPVQARIEYNSCHDKQP